MGKKQGQAKTRVRDVEEEQVRSDGDTSGQDDLCLAHVGQRLFEMLRRSCGMARGRLARINKHKSEGEECYSTMEKGRSSAVNPHTHTKKTAVFYQKSGGFEGLRPQ